MCPIPQPASGDGNNPAPPAPPKKDPSVSCFTCTRLNATTFVIIEEDKWYEIPYIYVKVYPELLVLVDTGCGGGDAAKNPAAGLTSIREYIETVPVADNDGRPLNAGSEKEYLVICTHCHFDHIGGIAQFPEADVWASAYDKAFLAKDVLATTSICRFFDMETPQYTVTHWADDGQQVVSSLSSSLGGQELGLFIYHTPGHTPDEIAIWDPAERVLFVGDTMYESVPICFPLEGDIASYFGTIDRLRELVRAWNEDEGENVGGETKRRVTMACGHATRDADAEKLIEDVELFLCRLLIGEVKGNALDELFREHDLTAYKETGCKINFLAPEKVFDQFRKNEQGMRHVRERVESRAISL
ncbi:beta-lactamase-like protein [Microdochium trichocladiopsis]|uniref:Beta-lactamase-like protein n=1 Tax=Microdochium trichocladiopsis TaxID=1682393 RepID=A0A9P9BPW7_9PEZI|nr:beta-lactamase-like protein [Microdochium trichocladiopsis]KAH7024956.1 beta-lactamase-like protein [Microdochium trichocladiopsis]